MNRATGNDSFNFATTSQGAFTAGRTAVNSASTSNGSDGFALILTATPRAGNAATTTASQIVARHPEEAPAYRSSISQQQSDRPASA